MSDDTPTGISLQTTQTKGSTLAINGNWGDSDKQRTAIIEEEVWYAVNCEMNFTQNTSQYTGTTTLEERVSTFEIKAPRHAQRTDNLITWFNLIKLQYPTAVLAKKAEATVYTYYTEEQLSTASCPCNTHRKSIAYNEAIKPCKAFRPRDDVNNAWRSELTSIELAGSPSKTQEEYEMKVRLALAEHDAKHGGFEAAVATVTLENDARELHRKVSNEINNPEWYKDEGSDDIPEGVSRYCTGNADVDSSDEINGYRKATYKWVVCYNEEAYFFSYKADAVKFDRELFGTQTLTDIEAGIDTVTAQV